MLHTSRLHSVMVNLSVAWISNRITKIAHYDRVLSTAMNELARHGFIALTVCQELHIDHHQNLIMMVAEGIGPARRKLNF